MKYLVVSFFVFLSVQLMAQENLTISLNNVKIEDFESRVFYFDQVIDLDKSDIIGYSKLEKTGKVKVLKFKSNAGMEVQNLLSMSFIKHDDQIGLQLQIFELNSKEKVEANTWITTITFHAQINLGDTVLYSNKLENDYDGWVTENDYAELISEIIKDFVYDFAMVPDQEIVKETSDFENTESFNGAVSRNVIAVGYQIGGYSLIGINYEIRVSDNIGVHFGAGYSGFTTGIKVHWKPTIDGGFINISFKDGGYGLINGWAVEYGSRKSFRQNEGTFGFHYQIGLALITTIDKDYMATLGATDVPFPMLSMGIGFSW